jgi:hypothetical protein
MKNASMLFAAVAAVALIATDTAAQPLPTAEPVPAPPAEARSIGLLMRMNFDFGGEELAHVSFSDGGMSTIKAGQLATFSGGLIYHPAAPWTLEATIGYKFDKKSASNGTIEFTRIPLDLVASFVVGGAMRLGAGPTIHLSPTFHCDAAVCGGEANISLSNSIGVIAQWAYGFSHGARSFDVGFRYTHMRYSSPDVASFDGSSMGLFFGGWL